MAHVRKLTGSKWQARYRDPDNRERAKNFRRRSDAERYLVNMEALKLRGEWVDPDAGKLPISGVAEIWMQRTEPRLKPKTTESYRSLMRSRILPGIGGVPVAALRADDVEAWLRAMEADGLSASRIRQAHFILSAMLDQAARDGRVGRNVARGSKLPKIQRREAPYFDSTDVDRIIEAAPNRYRAFLAVQGMVGLRFGEAASVRRRSVNVLRRRLSVTESLADIHGQLIFGSTKTHAERDVPLSPTLVELLAGRLEDVPPDPEAIVFTSTKGFPIRYSAFRKRVWHPILDGLNLERLGLHALRHSAAARMIAAEWSPKAVQQVLGHQSAAFTLTVYGHLFDRDLDELAEKLDVRPADSTRTHGGAP